MAIAPGEVPKAGAERRTCEARSVERALFAKAGGGLVACVFAGFCAWSVADAAPYIPSDGQEVLERTPSRADPGQRVILQLRAQLARKAGDLRTASELARLYIDKSRADGDPRFLGYAQAVLRPWWNLPEPPSEVRMLRATILESSHKFEEALADIDSVLQPDGRSAQAWLTRATVMTVLGRYDQAKTSCLRLYRLAADLVTQACLSSVGSLSGSASASYRALSQALQRNADRDPGVSIWVLTLLGEIAARLGEDAAAEHHFREAMMLAPADAYLLGAYSDFLLDRHRPAEVVDLLEQKGRNDSLLLRHALALRAQGSSRADKEIEILRQRFAAAAMRKDTAHQREQSRFELHLLGKPELALATARRNWDVQKEPGDVRVLLEAAIAANDKPTTALVIEWLQKTRYEDQAIAKLLEKIKGKT